MSGSPLWSPPPERAAASLLEAFRARAEAVAGADLPGYPELHAWSVADPGAFWSLVWDDAGVVGHRGERALVRGDHLAEARFFPDARLNVAEHLLSQVPPHHEVLVGVDERGGRRSLTGAELRLAVGAAAGALRQEGVGPGHRVVAWMPNVPETVVVMLAAASLGATFSSTSPDFGSDGVLDRFAQIDPTVLVAADGYTYGGRPFDRRAELAAVVAGLPTLRRTVVVGVLDPGAAAPAVPGAVRWDDWVAAHEGAHPAFERLPFDHPWYVLFSSGTTGPPKCIVHRAGGVLLKHLEEHRLQVDLQPGHRACYFTTCGWMMWNWLVSAPGSGATAVLYEGNPFHPGPDALWRLVEQERLTFLGVSAKYLDALAASGTRPAEVADLTSLRTLASTGSPLSPEGFAFAYEAVAPGCPEGLHLASISGGTDLCGCFVAGDPTSAVWPGEIQRPALGMAVAVLDEAGHPQPPGERGELACREPFPSMPLGFWGDGPLGELGPRYRAAYFERFPGVWAHGDFASTTEHGGVVIHGRSDTTLNPGGVRIGTAEIYRQVERVPEVLEALVFGQDWEGDNRIVLLVRLAPGEQLTEQLDDEIRRRIRTGCTPRHVPAVILAVADLPRTRSGKLAELAVADRVNGRPVRNTTALANPEALDEIAGLPGLQRPS